MVRELSLEEQIRMTVREAGKKYKGYFIFLPISKK